MNGLDLFFVAILILLALIPRARKKARLHDHRGTQWAALVESGTAPAGPSGERRAQRTIKKTSPRAPG